jgi:hypothetical protein
MAGWNAWLSIIGGVLAIVGMWWGMSWYLSAIGGVLAIIGGFMSMK